MKKSDSELGMGQGITRRDLIHNTGVAVLGASLAPLASGSTVTKNSDTYYPPTQTGLRGSHPGSFELAHALRDGVSFKKAKSSGEEYDLVVVGAGISGLAAAYYYQKRFGRDSKILILENHDDFGGHARRNEFHQGGQMRLSMGGTHNLEHWKFSSTVKTLMHELGIEHENLIDEMEFEYGLTPRNGPAIWFDKDSYGTDRLVTRYTLQNWMPGTAYDCIDDFPLSTKARDELKNLYQANTNVLSEMSRSDAEKLLSSISYPDFLRQYAGLSDEAIQIFETSQHGAWGLELRALSAAEGFYSGLPGLNLVGAAQAMKEWEYPVAMFPDGNASIARLLVQKLIPAVAPDANVDNIAVSEFDYARLDDADAAIRMRLSSTVVNATQEGQGVSVTYASAGSVAKVSGKHCVMACYHSILPYLIPELPEAQKEAQKYQVKIPLVLANVLLRSSEAMDKLGIDMVNCPGRMFRSVFMFKGINTGGYTHKMADDGTVPLVFWGSISPPKSAFTVKEQLRGSRHKMLSLSIDDYEREIRTVLDGLLGPAGFDVQKDILAITVNRWPHGYAYGYLDLWDENFSEGSAPHEIARLPFGNITFANSDSGADAYTHVAIDEASRAIKDIKSPNG